MRRRSGSRTGKPLAAASRKRASLAAERGAVFCQAGREPPSPLEFPLSPGPRSAPHDRLCTAGRLRRREALKSWLHAHLPCGIYLIYT